MRSLLLLLSLVAAALALPAQAALQIQISEGATGAMPIAVVPFEKGKHVPQSVDLASVITADLRGTGLFDPLPVTDMLATPSRPEEVTFRNWRAVNVDYLVVGSIKAKSGRGYRVQFAILDVYQQRILAGFRIVAGEGEMRDVAHTIANKIYQTLTGHPGYFRSRIAYVTASMQDGRMHYKLVVADYDGHDAEVILATTNPIMSPDWHPAGTKLAYVVIDKQKGRSSIRIRDLITGEVRIISARPGLNSAPAWSPTGNKIAMTLSYEGNPNIYIYNLVTGTLRQFTHSPAIDTGAAWSPDGGYIVFTSGRGGAPQIYRMPVHGGQAKRLTYRGESNQNAVYAPDGKTLAFVQESANGYRIALLDLSTNYIRVVSNGPRDESPDFAPNGQALIFASQERGGGLVVLSLNSGAKRTLQTPGAGIVRSPAWGPAP